ncbi:MAG: class I SAM-dependent methyltransferase [Planctomycetia bacterium]|nr:class I SAM-dependent methyltransferase [Planctomycetia bacterium]
MSWGSLYGAGSPAVDFYDAMHAPGTLPCIDGDVEFYRAAAGRARGAVLELACGTGRVTIPLAMAGHDVTALDASAGMLRVARAKSAGLPIRFVKGDMRRFRLGRRFKLIFVTFRSFQALLTPADQRACLASVRRHLAPGGRFIVNVFDPKLEYCIHGPSPVISRYRSAVDPDTGNVCRLKVLRRVNDAVSQTLTETWRYVVRDRRGRLVCRQDRRLRLRWTYRWEMAHLFELSGLEPEACYGDFRGGGPRYGAEQIWVVKRAR